MRINKFVAHATGLSRREADNAIQAGRVRLNNHVAPMGAQVKDTDSVAFDGKLLRKQQSYVYMLLHKPVGYVCSRRRQGDNPTIYELLPDNLQSLKTAGRLDKDSSGLILLTNDGDFAFHMTHPSFYKTKLYDVTLNHPLEPLHQQLISDHGVTLEDGVSQFMVETITLNDQPGSSHTDTPQYRVTMHEGRNRQIRRTFAALGYRVISLHRTQFGPYLLDELKPGAFRAFSLES